MKSQTEFFCFLTFRPNNVFFVFYKQTITSILKTNKVTYRGKVIVSTSCGVFKEKGIKRHNAIAFESNFKNFLQKIKAKKIYFKHLNLIINTSRPKNKKEKLIGTFNVKYYLKIILKRLIKEKLSLTIINNQKFAFNGCKLPTVQRKKIRRKKRLVWFKLFKK